MSTNNCFVAGNATAGAGAGKGKKSGADAVVLDPAAGGKLVVFSFLQTGANLTKLRMSQPQILQQENPQRKPRERMQGESD